MIETRWHGPMSDPRSNKVVGDFVSTVMFGHPGELVNYCSMGVLRDGALVAGVIYHDYYPDTGVVEISAAAVDKKWMTRGVVRDIFSMPFERLGCQMIAMRTSELNHSVRSILERYGVKGITIPRMRGRNEAEILYTVTEEEWRASPFMRTNEGS